MKRRNNRRVLAEQLETRVLLSAVQLAPPVSYTALGTGQIAIGDVNGDGIPDVISRLETRLSVLLGKGDGTLAPSVETYLNSGTGGVTLGDFNGDGRTDISYPIYPLQSGGVDPNTGILLSNGDGTFTAAPNVPMFSLISTSGDFKGNGGVELIGGLNSDPIFGHVDFIVATSNGDGTFSLSQPLPYGFPNQIITGDFNGDHKLDFAFDGDSNSYCSLNVIYGNGDGTFTPTAAYQLPFFVSPNVGLQIASADVNGDGRPDLMAFNYALNKMVVLSNNGNGTFTVGDPQTWGVNEATSVTLADMNGDGIPDLISCDDNPGSVLIRTGQGDGTFGATQSISIPNAGWVEVADLNNDGAPDIVVGKYDSTTLSVLMNKPATITPTPLTAVEGSLIQNPSLFHFSPNYGTLKTAGEIASLNWGDGTTSTGYLVPSSDGGFDVGGSHTYQEEGTYTVSLTLRRQQFVAATATLQVVVSDAPISASSLSAAAVVGAPVTAVVASFNDANPFAVTSDFSATVAWGDGTTSPAVIQPNSSGGFNVLGTHTYHSAQSYSAAVSIYDGTRFAAAVNASLTVGNPVHGGGTISGNVFNDTNRDSYREVGELPLIGWTEFVDENNDGVPDNGEPTALSSADGSYTLADVPAGVWTIQQVIPSGWASTLTPPSNGIPVTFRKGQILNGVDFGAIPNPPTVTTARFNYDQYPPSLTFTFSEPVTGADTDAAVNVYDVDNGQPVLIASTAYNSQRNTLTVTFGGPLSDGNYEAVLYAGAIQDANGQSLAPTAAGVNYVYNFYSLTGDINRDGTVNAADSAIVSAHTGSPGTFAQGDLNGDSFVNSADATLLAAHQGATVTPPLVHAGDVIVTSTFDKVGNAFNGKEYAVTPGGGKTLLASGLSQPWGVAADSFGNLYVAEVGASPTDQLARISNAGALSMYYTFASDRTNPEGVTILPDGTVLVTGIFSNNGGFPPPGVAAITPDGQLQTYATVGNGENTAATLDSAGNLYISDAGGPDNGSLWKVTPAGAVSEVAVGLGFATGLAMAPDGHTVLVSDTIHNQIWAVAPNGTKSIYVTIPRPAALIFDAQGDLYVGQDQDSNGQSSLLEVRPDLTIVTVATGFNGIRGLTIVQPPAASTRDTFTLQQDLDHQHIDWTDRFGSGQVAITDPNGLTLQANRAVDTLKLDYSNGDPLPAALHLKGTFVIDGVTAAGLGGTSLDIGQNTVYLRYATPNADPIAMVRRWLQAGSKGGTWNGTPNQYLGVITSAGAQSDSTHTTGIGYSDWSDGQTADLTGNTVELKYTLYGDTGLTGTVGFTDFMRMTQHYTLSNTNWTEGDFNYDGTVAQSDFSLLQPNYGHTLSTSASPQAPEMTPIPLAPAPPAAPASVFGNVNPSGSAASTITDTVDNKRKSKAKAQKIPQKKKGH